MSMKAFHAHTRATDPSRRLGKIVALDTRLSTPPILVMGPEQGLRIDLILVVMHSPNRFKATDLVVQRRIHQPIERRHRRPIVEMGCVFDDDRCP